MASDFDGLPYFESCVVTFRFFFSFVLCCVCLGGHWYLFIFSCFFFVCLLFCIDVRVS